MKDKVLVTGASGFLGSYFIDSYKNVLNFVGVYRNIDQVNTPEHILIETLNEKINWQQHLNGIDCVLHCAARVHVMNDQSEDSLEAFRLVNTIPTIHLAKEAAKSGVKRFIFISSIKVNGEFTNIKQAFREEDRNTPDDPYGRSKYDAEESLRKLAHETSMEVVIIRPPLVYGPGVRANFRSMLKWVKKGVPLPLGAIDNKRSLVGIGNLANFIKCCIDNPNAANEIFLITDGEDVSTTELLRKVGKAFNRNTMLIPIPVKLMQIGARIIGRKDLADRIFGNLQVDSSKAENLLGWKPVMTMDQELKRTVDAYLNEKNI